MKKLVSNLLVVISVAMLIWIGTSYVEIICKNTSPNPEYSDNNVIVNVVEWANEYYGYED